MTIPVTARWSPDIFYVEGPGDIVESFRSWRNSEDLQSETSRTFSGQFFDFCQAKGHHAYAISHCERRKAATSEAFRVENIPKALTGRGIKYHISQVLYGISILWKCIRHRPSFVVVSSGVTHFFVLAPCRLIGVKVVGLYHNCLWPTGYEPTSRAQRTLLKLEGWFLRKISEASICVSPEIAKQIRMLTGRQDMPVETFLPQFRRQHFAHSQTSPESVRPFTLVYVGRLERNKGIFDIIEIAAALEAEDVVFDVCGDGSCAEELQAAVHDRGLKQRVRLHGRLERPRLLAIYLAGHAVIVPTRSDFAEGFAMVAAEAILMYRPAICSAVVPAADVLKGAVIKVPANDVDAFVEAILRLIHDPAFYGQLQSNCAALREQFFDDENGLTGALNRLLR